MELVLERAAGLLALLRGEGVAVNVAPPSGTTTTFTVDVRSGI